MKSYTYSTDQIDTSSDVVLEGNIFGHFVPGELTGELPPEIPLEPGEPVPTIRKRVGTEFALSEALLQRMQSSPEEELLAKLELEFEIQSKITSAGKD